MSRISESQQIAYLIETADKAGAGADTDAIDMSRFSSVTFIFAFGAITGNSTLLFYGGATNALAAAKGTAIAFRYRLAAADCGNTLADTHGTETDATTSGITLTAATYDHKTLLVEFDCDELGSTNRWVVAALSTTANPLNVACVAIGKPRYPGNTQVTAL
jgi:hypothetical protein